MIKQLKLFSTVLLAMAVITGCAETGEYGNSTEGQDTTITGDMDNRMGERGMQASSLTAVLNPTQNSEVEGQVTFTKEGNGVRVSGEVSGLEQGQHGFHIHQYGDCSASDASSAGGHFNPAGNDHGARTDSVRHMGDMGNIQAESNGNATVDYVDEVIELNQIVGRAVVVHGGEDDLTSQPSGAAGDRMACGVIGIAQADTASM